METSPSLLDRLKSSPEDTDWEQLVSVYTPVIHGWLRRYSASAQDVDDVVQEVMSVVIRKLPLFERARLGSFRAWLRTITVNCLRESWRSKKFRPSTGSDFEQVLDFLGDPGSELSRIWDAEYDERVLQSLLGQVQSQMTDSTWEMFRRVAVEGESSESVAADLGVTVNALYIARSRVMTKLRTLGRGLME